MFLDDKKKIGRIIQFYRKKRGLTQAELSEKADISEKHLSKIETGLHFPSISAFFRIREVLDIRLEEFGVHINSSSESPERQELLKYIFDMNEIETSYMLSFAKFTFDNYRIEHKSDDIR